MNCLLATRYRLHVWTTNSRLAYVGLLFFAVAMVLRLGAETLLVSNSGSPTRETETLLSMAAERYDELKLSSGTNYPVCQRLDELYRDLLQEERARSDTEAKYAALYADNKLHCGLERVFGPLWIFGKKHNIRRPAAHCVPQILDAKRRLLTWLGDLCAVQDKYNHYWRLQTEHLAKQAALATKSKGAEKKSKEKEKAKSALHVTSPYRARKLGTETGVAASAADAPQPTPVRVALTPATARTRGLIYTGLPLGHFKDIYQSILAHRNLKVSLPVEVWVNEADMDICKEVFESSGAFEFLFEGQEPMPAPESDALGTTRCRSLPSAASGFASKYHALLGTKFTDVFFMDADNLAVRDVNEVFDSVEYKSTGAVMWPDMWGEACRQTLHRADNGYTGFETSVLWQAHVGGLQWKNTRTHAQEAEAGQIAFDLTRHAGLLEVGRRMIDDGRFFKHVVNGDKDIFRLVHLIAGEPFTFVNSIPGYSTASPAGGGRDCLTHYFGTGGEAGDGNAIAADRSGAFEYFKPSLVKADSEAGTKASAVKGEPPFMFKFGSFVGSFFGEAGPKRNSSECQGGSGGNCGGMIRERDGIVNINGHLVKMEDLSLLEQEQYRVPKTKESAGAGAKGVNALGNPAGTGWNAPIGTDPMFFHQLKNRDPLAFRFAYRLQEGAQEPSVCYDFAAGASTPGKDGKDYKQVQLTYKHPSADRLKVFMNKLFLQVDWKWDVDRTNSWSSHIYWHSWRQAVNSKYTGAVELLVVPMLLFAVAILILLRKTVSGAKSV